MPFAKAIQNDQSYIKTNFGMISKYTLYFEYKFPYSSPLIVLNFVI